MQTPFLMVVDHVAKPRPCAPAYGCVWGSMRSAGASLAAVRSSRGDARSAELIY